MIKKVYKEGPAAREAIAAGINKAADKILITEGSVGRNALLGRAYQSAEMTNDGKTIAEDIYLEDEIEQLGAETVKEMTSASFDKGGDSTTATVNLYRAFVNVGMDMLKSDNDFIASKSNPIKVRDDIQKAAKEIAEHIDKAAKPVKTFEDMQKVAFAATENMEHASILANMFSVIGKDGDVTIEDGYNGIIESEIVEGFTIEAGFSSELIANNEDNTYSLENPFVLVTNVSIDYKDQITPITKALYEEGIHDLIIVADNFSKEVLGSFVESKLNNWFNIVAIKAPYFGKKENMKDIASALGAAFFDKEGIIPLQDAIKEHMGTAKKIIVTKDLTTFIKPKGNSKERIKDIQKLLKANTSRFDQEQLRKRLAKLSGGIGVIKVGSATQKKIGYLKKKILNGKNSVKYALEGGAIKGAGLTLIDIANTLPNNILSEAIRSPYNQIQKNAGGNLKIPDTILDTAISIKNAVLIAAEGAGDVMTIEFANADKYDEPEDYKEVE